MEQRDLLFAVLPIQPLIYNIGCAVLKSNLEKHNFTSKIIDFNYELYKDSGCTKKLFEWSNDHGQDYIINNEFTPQGEESYKKLLDIFIEKINYYKPKYIGLSVNNLKYNLRSAIYFMEHIRPMFPDIKVVVGGSCFYIKNAPYYNDLIDDNIVDFVICGDAEDGLVEILKTGTWKNDFVIHRSLDLANYPNADYLDYPDYPVEHRSASIIFSRGCVFNCKFCIISKKIVIKEPVEVVNEIVDISKKYNIHEFMFADSLINFNENKLLELLKLISEKQALGELKKSLIFWGYWKCLKSKDNYKLIFQEMNKIGTFFLSIGIESGSDELNEFFRKTYVKEHLLNQLKEMANNNIRPHLLFLIGHYLETDEAFQETLDLIEDIYGAIGNQYSIQPGYTYQSIYELDHLYIKDDGLGSWYYEDNTYPKRIKRWIQLCQKCKQQGARVSNIYRQILRDKIDVYKDVYDVESIKKIWREVYPDDIL